MPNLLELEKNLFYDISCSRLPEANFQYFLDKKRNLELKKELKKLKSTTKNAEDAYWDFWRVSQRLNSDFPVGLLEFLRHQLDNSDVLPNVSCCQDEYFIAAHFRDISGKLGCLIKLFECDSTAIGKEKLCYQYGKTFFGLNQTFDNNGKNLVAFVENLVIYRKNFAKDGFEYVSAYSIYEYLDDLLRYD